MAIHKDEVIAEWGLNHLGDIRVEMDIDLGAAHILMERRIDDLAFIGQKLAKVWMQLHRGHFLMLKLPSNANAAMRLKMGIKMVGLTHR